MVVYRLFRLLRKLFILFLVPLLYSCVDENNNLLDHFNYTEDLNVTDSILLENYGILNPHYIYKKDSFLIFNSIQGKREIQLLSLKDYRTYTYCVIGQGKNEMNNYFTVLDQASDCYRFADNSKGKIYGIDLNELEENKETEYKLMNTLSINNGTHFIRFMDTGKYLLGSGIIKNGRFGIYDKSEYSYTEQAGYPYNDEINKIDNIYKGALFSRTIMTPHPQGKRFVAACFGLLDFYAISDEGDIQLIKSKHYHYPKFKANTSVGSAITFDIEDMVGITGLISDDKYVYVLYSDKTFKHDKEAAYNASHLLVYDWEGNPIKHYHLNKDLYAISKSGDVLYGLSRVNNPIVYCCKLNL